LLSLAIDEFPVMDEVEVERFGNLQNMKRRGEREEAIRRVEFRHLLGLSKEEVEKETMKGLCDEIDKKWVEDKHGNIYVCG